MVEKRDWFWLVVAAWLLVLLVILLTTPAGAQTPSLKGIEWRDLSQTSGIELRVCALSVVARGGLALGCLTPDNKTHLHRLVKRVCPPWRFRRNMRAAVKGSNKAHRYLESCAAKLSR